jgi:GAF domain-containing protein
MSENDRAERIADFVAELSDVRGEVLTTKLIVERALSLVPDAEHCSLTVRSRRSYTTLAATSALAGKLDRAQYELDEGPCVDSVENREWYRSGAVGSDPRWPRWGPVATRHGINSLLSVRLLAGDEAIGALNLYSRAASRFTDRDEVELALLFAVHATQALVSARLITNLETALSSRFRIGVAHGILISRYGMTEEQAFRAMARISQQSNTKLRDVAEEIIQRGKVPESLGDSLGEKPTTHERRNT